LSKEVLRKGKAASLSPNTEKDNKKRFNLRKNRKKRRMVRT